MTARRSALAFGVLLVVNGVLARLGAPAAPPSPRDVLGIDVGANRVLGELRRERAISGRPRPGAATASGWSPWARPSRAGR